MHAAGNRKEGWMLFVQPTDGSSVRRVIELLAADADAGAFSETA